MMELVSAQCYPVPKSSDLQTSGVGARPYALSIVGPSIQPVAHGHSLPPTQLEAKRVSIYPSVSLVDEPIIEEDASQESSEIQLEMPAAGTLCQHNTVEYCTYTTRAQTFSSLVQA